MCFEEVTKKWLVKGRRKPYFFCVVKKNVYDRYHHYRRDIVIATKTNFFVFSIIILYWLFSVFFLLSVSNLSETAFTKTLNWLCCGLRRREAAGAEGREEPYKATTSKEPDFRQIGMLKWSEVNFLLFFA